jgi:YD repeat-containing protein
VTQESQSILNGTAKAVNYTYDKAGNLTLAYSADRGTSYIYKYDHHNRLTGVYDSTGTTRKAAFTWDALGRRIEFVNDVLAGTPTTRYYYDGVNEVAEYDGSGNRSRTYVHGISYVDERLMMHDDATSRPYYYAVNRMYDVVTGFQRGHSTLSENQNVPLSPRHRCSLDWRPMPVERIAS